MRHRLVPIAFFLALAACGGGTPKTPVATAPASMRIIAPKDGGLYPPTTDRIRVTADVANFRLADKISAPPLAGEGHLVFYLDVAIDRIASGAPLTAGSYKASVDPSYEWTALKAGRHVFGVQLVNNDSSPFSPPVVAVVTVTIER